MPVKPARGSVRIIAGKWRSRRLPVIDVPGLRPSSDRSRETLFNWIQTIVPGSRCVDLFAGTGALGFEAASRGADSVDLVEKNSVVVATLQRGKETLNADQVMVHRADALSWLESQPENIFRIIFVDPPFNDDLHETVMEKIEESGCLVSGGLVYVETPTSQAAPLMPAGWSVWREKVLGEIRMQVFRR
jgi:16S rRNA (guanine966-N2)-methyltransferase